MAEGLFLFYSIITKAPEQIRGLCMYGMVRINIAYRLIRMSRSWCVNMVILSRAPLSGSGSIPVYNEKPNSIEISVV